MTESAGWRPADAVMRGLDILFAGVALILAAPLFLVLVPLLLFTGEGAVLYRQIRVGRYRRPFGLLKFATMVKGASAMGAGELTLPNDTRVLPVGRFLRKTKLNELPQLINILTGDLSVIGPRPQTPRYFDDFRPEHRDCVASVRPGLSGAGSVLFRDEEAIFARVPDPIAFDHEVIMPYKGEVECWYVANRSVALYLELLVATALVVLMPGANFRRRLLARVPQPPAALAGLL
jgi:lipopolysaccharide/colanic/teichoic acid biosynthesis glycosyltransferase